MPAGNSQYSTTSRNTAADAVAALANTGKLRIYDGTQPANANTAVSGQVKLAEFTFPNPAFAAASGGVATANPIDPVAVIATGKATWFRIVKSDGTTVVCDGNVGGGAAVTTSGSAVVGATSIPVTALTFPVYAGTVLNFGNGAYATVTTDAAIGATALATVGGLVGRDLVTGDAASFNLVMNAAFLVLAAQASIDALTLTELAAGQ